MTTTAPLQAKNLTLEVAGRVLCRDLTVAFGGGENWVILGPNGSGKTTLLHALAGLRPADAGAVLLDARAIGRHPHRARARKIGVLFQEYETAFPAGVLETVLLGRHPHLSRWQWESADDRRLAEDALAVVELSGFAGRALATLSGGERRRGEIAALLVQDAPILLMDEPTNHLDLHHQVRMLEILSDRARRPGCLNIFVLHNVNLAARFGSHGILLFGDGNCLHGRLSEILQVPALERLYRCQLREIADERRRYFLPA